VRTTAQATTAQLVALRSGLGALPAGVSVIGTETGLERLDTAVGPMRSAGAFFGGLAAVAAIVALLGLHTTLAHTVELRTRDIALRQALGATPAQVTRSVFQTPLAIVVSAAVIGGFGAMMLSPLLAAQTRGLESDAWAVYPLSVGMIAGGCLLIAASSALKALRLPLMRVLRDS
jgi:ABC-type antimicrobial peptide transport system permease subunit